MRFLFFFQYAFSFGLVYANRSWQKFMKAEYRVPAEGAEPLTAQEKAIRDEVVKLVKGSGIEVVTDSQEAQEVIDGANGGTRLQAIVPALGKAARTIKNWLANGTRGKSFTIELPEATQRMIRKVMGRDFDSHNITANGIVHALKNHGEYGEKTNAKSIPLRESDMELAPYIMTAPDYVSKGSTDALGRTSIRFYKILSNGHVVVVEKEYKNSPDDMETITMWAEMSDRATNARQNSAPDTHVQNAIPDIDVAKIRKDAETAIKKDQNLREHRVYHGSGNDFDHFDHGHMGEGEGAQAYGWGTYVTEVEGIGRAYAKQTARFQGLKDTESVKERLMEKAHSVNYDLSREAADYIVDRAERLIISGAEEYGDITPEELLNFVIYDAEGRENELLLDALRLVKPEDLNFGTRNLYTVEIPEDTGSNYLDWDAPVEESVKEQMKKRILKEKHSDDEIENEMLENDVSDSLDEAVDGKALYKAISMYLGDKDASMALSSLGYTGIKYPADYRRGGNKEGKKNYVVFNEKDAKITDHVRFFRTPDGEAYGFTVGGKIYIDPRIAKADTPIHEYAHLWATALRAGNAKEWRNVVELMKGTPVWDEVRKLYPELSDDDAIADEVLAQYSGRRGAERLRQEMRTATEKAHGLVEKSMVVKAFDSVRTALDKFWRGVADFLHIHYTTAEEVADRVLRDLLSGE